VEGSPWPGSLSIGGVSVCIAAGALYLLIFSCRPLLWSIAVLGKGGRVRTEGSWV